MKKINRFLYQFDKNLESGEQLRVFNHSHHQDLNHHILFFECDRLANSSIISFHNNYANSLYEKNNLVIINDEKDIENAIIESIKKRVPDRKITKLNNPEKLYKSYNFFKPPTLLPKYQFKLNNIKKIGEDEKENQIIYIINPYFFACRLCYIIFVHSHFFKKYDSRSEEGLTTILSHKYGKEFNIIYNYVSSFWETLKDEKTGSIIKAINPYDLKSFTGIEEDELINIYYNSVLNQAFKNFKENFNQLYPDGITEKPFKHPFATIKTK